MGTKNNNLKNIKDMIEKEELKNKRKRLKMTKKLKERHPSYPLVFKRNSTTAFMNRLLPKDLRQMRFMKQQTKSTRWRSKRLFLTYLDCPLSLMKVLTSFKKKFSRINSPKITDYVLGIENDKIGINIRVYLEFNKKIDTNNINFFDLKGDITQGPLPKKSKNLFLVQEYTPDVSYIKNKLQCIKYIIRDKSKKDGTLLISPTLNQTIS